VGKLLLLFTIVPVVELYLLGQLAAIMGLGSTLALVLVTGVLGASLARAQGRQVLLDWQASLSRGELPESGVTDALLVIVGGVLLVTPGVLTDFVGLSLLLPPPRRLIGRLLVAYFKRQIAAGHLHVARPGGFGPGGRAGLGGFRGLDGLDGVDGFDALGGQPPGSQGAAHPAAEGPREEIRVKATVRDVEPDRDDP